MDKAKERLSSPRGQGLLLQRKVSAEGVFALAKELHGLRRTRFMGRWKVQIQLWLTAAVINIKRVVKQLVKTETMAGSQEDTNSSLITGMLGNAVEKIARAMHHIFAYTSTSATVPADYIQS